jgi:hypothetical protein
MSTLPRANPASPPGSPGLPAANPVSLPGSIPGSNLKSARSLQPGRSFAVNAAAACESIAKASPPASAVRTVTGFIGPSRFPRFGDEKARLLVLGWLRARTVPIAPAGPSPATAPATSCIPFSTTPVSPPNRIPSPAATACSCRTAGSAPLSAARLPITRPSAPNWELCALP